MAPVNDYKVRAKRAGKYWELHIDGVGVTQARTLSGDADAMIRDYVAMMAEVPADDVTYDLAIEVGGELDAAAAAAREKARKVEEEIAESAEENRAVARRLSAAGLIGREIAMVLNVSPQRASQYLAGATGTAKSARKGARGTAKKASPARQRAAAARAAAGAKKAKAGV